MHANLAVLPAKKKHLDSRWTPENHLDSGGVHLEYVGQGKVLVQVGQGVM